MKEEERRFSIHVRAWGAGTIVVTIGLTTILGLEESPILFVLYLLLIPLGWAVYSNEKAEKPSWMK